MNVTKKILVTGAGGFIGGYIVEEAIKQGYSTWAGVRRSTSKEYLTDRRISFVTLDYGHPEKLREQLLQYKREMGGWDYIVHNLGLTKSLNKEDFYRINYEYTRNFIEALQDCGMTPRKFVHMSSLSAWGKGDEKNYTPFKLTDTPHPDTHYGKSKLMAEQYIAGLSDFPYIILRPTGVYGPRDKDYQLLIRSIRAHIDLSLGRRPQRVTFVYVKDLVEAVFLALRKGVQRCSYLVTDGNTYNSSDFTRAVRAALGDPFTLHLTIPLWLGRVAARITDMAGRLCGRTFTFNSDKFRILAQRNWQCDITPLTEELGYHPHYNLEAGIAETLATQELFQ